VARHARFTGSARAKDILDRWDEVLPNFVKVMPTDYRRALTQMAGETRAKRDAEIRIKRARNPAVESMHNG
jgi:glutamate synthase (NADPH/NADH) large chain